MKEFSNFYRLITNAKDPRHKQSGAIGIKPEDCRDFNNDGYDIFWTMNGFEFGKRKKEELKWINCFYVDLDSGEKNDMKKKIRLYPEPSTIIETGRGFHLYWWLDKEINCEHDPVGMANWFRHFVVNRLLPVFNADVQAADACRLLRAPLFRYWKDGVGEKRIDIVYESEKFYGLEYLEKYFPLKAEERKVNVVERVPQVTGSFWTDANNLPIVESLEKLSGTTHVMGENYKIKKWGSRFRVDCNNKKMNVWIDEDGIGSTAGAGPRIPNWLFYYHRDWKTVAKIIKEVFRIGELNG